MEISFDSFITIIVFLLGLAVSGVGWWVNQMWSMLKKQQELLALIQIELAKNYIPRIELQETFRNIYSKLDDIPREMRLLTQQLIVEFRKDKER